MLKILSFICKQFGFYLIDHHQMNSMMNYRLSDDHRYFTDNPNLSVEPFFILHVEDSGTYIINYDQMRNLTS